MIILQGSNIESGVENRAWDDKLYFPPIKLDEMNKNNMLIQNPGYYVIED
jgi:hypothetical protein